MKEANEVFVGTIESIRMIPGPLGHGGRGSNGIITFKVLESLKGRGGKLFALHTSMLDASCGGLGGTPVVGTKMVVFARMLDEDDRREWVALLKGEQLPRKLYDTSICSGNGVESAENPAKFAAYLKRLRAVR